MTDEQYMPAHVRERLPHILFVCILAPLLFSCNSRAQTQAVTQQEAQKEVRVNRIRFPKAWTLRDDDDEIPSISYVQQLEVRRLPDSAANEFFFAALPYGDNDYTDELYTDFPKPTYSKNYYAVNFDDPSRVRTLSSAEWNRAKRLLSKPRLMFAREGQDVIEYRGLKFAKQGKYWGRAALSPRGKWLAVFSYNGEKTEPGFFGFLGGGEPQRGDVFYDVYDAETGERVLAWNARDVEAPLSYGTPLVWVEERYLLMPQDRQARSFMVVELPGFVPQQNPMTVNLPSRVGADGKRVEAPQQNEAWAPLAPLTKEQIARITAPSPTAYEEVRRAKDSNSKEILISIREETENRTRPLRGRDGAGDYNYRLFSTYYYAVTLAPQPTARFATQEEWERAVKLSVSRHQVTLEETRDTTGGRRREYRPFPKTGEMWGTPRALDGGEWVAVFSYTGKTEGVMFVDVYSRSSGALMFQAQSPCSGSADALFKGALWIEGSYLIIPTSASLDSFQLLTLPGGTD
jgi:hypothetical protein